MHTQLCIAAMAQFIKTNQGGKNLHFEGYVYTKIRDGTCKQLTIFEESVTKATGFVEFVMHSS